MLTPDTCRGLTLYQPWAQLLAHGMKRWETRSWSTSWRGTVFVHASARPSRRVERAFADLPAWRHLRACGDPRTSSELPGQAILATAELVECGPIREGDLGLAVGWPSGPEQVATQLDLDCGDYRAGRWAWRLRNVQPLTVPVPASGRQRLWIPSLELCAAVEAALPWRRSAPPPPPDDLHARIAP